MGNSYAQFRPTYPQAFIDYLCNKAGISKDSVVADIGSGTGILARQLLEVCAKVFVVEPNSDMRVIAEADLCGYTNFESIHGSAENTTLPNTSLDCITVAQAFHWFDRQRFKDECKRILRGTGKVILVWNCRDEASSLVCENDTVIRNHCPNFKGYSGGMRGEENEGDFMDFFTGEYDKQVFRNDLTFDEHGFIGRNLSGSYAPKDKVAPIVKRGKKEFIANQIFPILLLCSMNMILLDTSSSWEAVTFTI
jgi:SAM-dependent methyltransferase